MAKRLPPASAEFTASADLINGLIDCAVARGTPRRSLTDLVDDRAGQSSRPARYAGGHILRLWERINRLSGDPIIGFRMARLAQFKTFGVLGQVLPRCANVAQAFHQTARYAAIASQGARLSVASDAETLAISLSLTNVAMGEVARSVLLWGLTNLCMTPGRLVGSAVRPQAVTCAFPAPPSASLHDLREHFPFTFDREDNRVVFDRGVGELAIPSSDAELQALIVETMERHLGELGPPASLPQGLMTVLRGMLNGTMPTLASLSARAGMSQRTLQRRLAESGTSFQELLQRVLRERSNDLLAGGRLSQTDIAFVLGYSEVSAFSRAYRSWTGHAPGAART